MSSKGSKDGVAAVDLPPLPPITVTRLEVIGELLELLLSEHQGDFISAGQRYRDAHRAGTSRPLQPSESVQLAVAITDEDSDRIATAERLQDSELRAYDEPAPMELMVAGVVALAAKVPRAIAKLVALVEMPPAEFQAMHEGPGVESITGEDLEISVLRARAEHAARHYSNAAGISLGEALSLPLGTVWQAMTRGMEHLTSTDRPSSLTGSAPQD